MALRLQAGAPGNLEVDLNDDGTAEATVDRATFDRIQVDARRGGDRVLIDEANGPFTDTEMTTIAGGRGDDTLLGGRGNEMFLGDAGDDTVDGNQGADVGVMGAGDDTFIWDPGDGSDTVEGQSGYDTMDFRGAAGAETFDVSANGGRVRFFRNPGNITMDTEYLERITVEALGGADAIAVNDLSGTDLRRLDVDLAAALGSTGGDGAADALTVNATPGDDDVSIRPDGGRVVVRGLAPKVVVSNSEAAGDTLTLNALGGEDAVRLGNGLGGLIRTTVNA